MAKTKTLLEIDAEAKAITSPIGGTRHGGACICVYCRLERANGGWARRDQQLGLVIEILGECVDLGLSGDALRQQYERCKAIKNTAEDPGPYLDPGRDGVI